MAAPDGSCIATARQWSPSATSCASRAKPCERTDAILGHSNPRSTAIYAHIQHEPSRRAANRVSKKIAAALSPKTASTGPLTLVDQKLMQALKSRFAKADTSARKLRKAIAALVEQSGASIEASDVA